MRVTNVSPLGRRAANGALLIASFDAEPAPGIVCRLTLVRSARTGEDVVWSTSGVRGPCVRLSRALQAELAATVRERLAEMAAALRDAA